MTGYLITAAAIGIVFCLMAVWPSLFPRSTSVDADPHAWIDQRIATETNPARRAAWRMIRNCKEDGQ